MDKAIVKAVRTLGYDQPTDVTIRKALGLTFIFKSRIYVSEREEEISVL